MPFAFLILAWAGLSPLGPFSTDAARATVTAAERSAPASSLEALVSASLGALDARDTAALARLSAGREEFLEAYPHFSLDTTAARRDFSLGFFLADNRKQMLRSLAAGRDGREGRRELARLAVDGPVEKYGPVTLFRGLRVWVREDSTEMEIRFLRTVSKHQDRWRIWSFADD